MTVPSDREPRLEQLRIATPCSADWNAMQGDDVVRHCKLCQLNVYNLSAMTRDEALDFIAAQEGRVCIRIYRREDGTVLTRDCPVGRSRWHRRMLAAVGSAAAVVFLLGGAVLAGATTLAARPTMLRDSWRSFQDRLASVFRGDPAPGPVMGDCDMGVVMGEALPPGPPEDEPPASDSEALP
ncbi:MAG: hypothetical protein KDA41_00385 [Planctomycetales bacterium]|nr:hypothetical protein [Planctomycetales bacterium]